MAKNVTVVTPSDKTGRDILIAAIVTVVGSIAVAFIAAGTAGKRQKRSLEAADDAHKDTLESQTEQHEETLKSQTEQHTESLNAEDRRLTQRLQHERKQQDVRHLRGFFDEIAMDYERVRQTLTTLYALRKAPISAQAGIMKAGSESYESRLAVAVALDRVALWFGDNHDVYRHTHTSRTLLDSATSSLPGRTASLQLQKIKRRHFSAARF